MLSRTFFDHLFWSEERQFSRAEAWLDLVRSAAWKTHKKIIKGDVFEVTRGGIVATERFLSDRWMWSRTKVRAFLALLESEGMIKQEKDQGNTTLFLCNYERFNSKKNQEKTKQEPSEDQRKTEIEEGKEDQELESTPRERRIVILPTLDQAKAFAPSAGVSPEIAEAWWLDCDSRPLAASGHFTDAKGGTIQKWQSALTSYGRKWQNNDNRAAAARPQHRSNGSRQPSAAPIHDPRDNRL